MRAVLIILGYFIGSVPFALVIGKLFYHTDIRQYGSGNPGGGNAGRVLGKKAGLVVMTLDLLKVSLVVLLALKLTGEDTTAALAGLAAGLGHCFPVFAGFHGGKAVAALYGFLFGLFAFGGRSPLYFFLPLVIFLAVLFIWRIIALSSILSSAAIALYVCLQAGENPAVKVVTVIYAVLILVRHRSNLKRMLQHQERKVTWVRPHRQKAV